MAGLQFLYMVLPPSHLSSLTPPACHYECRTAGCMQHIPADRILVVWKCIKSCWKRWNKDWLMRCDATLMMVCLSNPNVKFPNYCSNFPAVPAAAIICYHLQAVPTIFCTTPQSHCSSFLRHIVSCVSSLTISQRQTKILRFSPPDHKMPFCLSPLQWWAAKMCTIQGARTCWDKLQSFWPDNMSLLRQRIIKATTWEPCAGNDYRVLEVLVFRSQEAQDSGPQVLTTHNNNITIITSAQTQTQFRNAHTIK